MAALTRKRSIASFDGGLGTLVTFPSRKLVQNVIQEKHYKKGFTSTDETIYLICFKMDDDYLGHKERIAHNLSDCALFRLPRELRGRIWKQYFEDNYKSSNGVIPSFTMPQTHYVRWKTFQDPGAGIRAPTMFLLDKDEKITGFQMSFVKAANGTAPRFRATLDFFCINDSSKVQAGLKSISPGIAIGKATIAELARCIVDGASSRNPGHLAMSTVEKVFTYASAAPTKSPLCTFGRLDNDYCFVP
ncbi:Hypothetical protein D9617_12g035330 [Elsinoe fawcettii]|nr:Hypothetical protein D9617_12g035330 [Elsinoe fawcettii]